MYRPDSFYYSIRFLIWLNTSTCFCSLRSFSNIDLSLWYYVTPRFECVYYRIIIVKRRYYETTTFRRTYLLAQIDILKDVTSFKPVLRIIIIFNVRNSNYSLYLTRNYFIRCRIIIVNYHFSNWQPFENTMYIPTYLHIIIRYLFT